jgi:hypothetical protein
MIFRYLLRRNRQSLDRGLLLPGDYKHKLEKGSYDWIPKMSEWPRLHAICAFCFALVLTVVRFTYAQRPN